MPNIRLSTLVVAGLAAAGLLAGCGSNEAEQAAAAKAQATATAAKPAPVKMVKASSPEDPGVPVGVTFDVRQKPVPGQPFEVALEITPTAEIAQFSARIEPSPGLEIRGGSNVPLVTQPAPGTPVQQLVSAVAAQDGVYTLRVIVTGPPQAGAEAGKSRTFFVPVIAGQGVVMMTPKPADGEAIEPPPAPTGVAGATGIPRRPGG